MNTGRDRAASAALLIALLALIWTRPSITALPAMDSYPLLLGIGVFVMLERPWKLLSQARQASAPIVFISMLFLGLGLIGQLVSLMALGWCLLVAVWVRCYAEPSFPLSQGILLCLFAFPWLATDLPELGWAFRYSGAYATEIVYQALGFSIQREGTFVIIQGLSVSVEPACAGMNLLPSLLLAGAALGILFMPGSPRFWLFVLLLLPLAWIANTLRIIVISGVALTWGTDFASGLFHTWGGLLILLFMFGMSTLLALILTSKSPMRPA